MGALKSKSSDDSSSHEVWTVLPHHMGGGPHGLGMPVAFNCRVNNDSSRNRSAKRV